VDAWWERQREIQNYLQRMRTETEKMRGLLSAQLSTVTTGDTGAADNDKEFDGAGVSPRAAAPTDRNTNANDNGRVSTSVSESGRNGTVVLTIRPNGSHLDRLLSQLQRGLSAVHSLHVYIRDALFGAAAQLWGQLERGILSIQRVVDEVDRQLEPHLCVLRAHVADTMGNPVGVVLAAAVMGAAVTIAESVLKGQVEAAVWRLTSI
jgi:hypothetical protein